MPFNGAGVFRRIANWTLNAAQNINILPDLMDTDTNDIASGLSQCITKDGQQTIIADIPWNNYGITGLRNPTSNQDAANKQWVNTADSARSMGGFNLTNLADPVNPQDAATKAWVGGTTQALPDQTGAARKFLKSNGLTANWAFQDLIRSARSSNTILGAADACTLVDITTGTFTQTFSAAATLGNGWYVLLRNSGSGDITLDPNGTELIDGLTSYIMYPGEVRLVECDGSTFTSVVLRPFSRSFTTSGTFTKPPGYQNFSGLAWSAGSSGQRSGSAATLAAGGSGGGCFPFTVPASTLGSTETVTIGAGGAAVTGTASGNVGGNTSLGSIFTVFGGATFTNGGAIGFNSALTFSGGNSVGFDGQASGSVGSRSTVYGGTIPSNDASTNSGNSIYGGAAGGGVDAAGNLRTPGASRFGGAGGAASIAANGTDGTAPGGGGGATQTGTQSGAGARGELRIWGIA